MVWQGKLLVSKRESLDELSSDLGNWRRSAAFGRKMPFLGFSEGGKVRCGPSRNDRPQLYLNSLSVMALQLGIRFVDRFASVTWALDIELQVRRRKSAGEGSVN